MKIFIVMICFYAMGFIYAYSFWNWHGDDYMRNSIKLWRVQTTPTSGSFTDVNGGLVDPEVLNEIAKLREARFDFNREKKLWYVSTTITFPLHPMFYVLNNIAR